MTYSANLKKGQVCHECNFMLCIYRHIVYTEKYMRESYNVKRTQFYKFFFCFSFSFFQTLLSIAINPLYHFHDLPKVLELISSGRRMHCVSRLRIDTSIAATTLLCSHFRFDTACNMRAGMLS